MKTLYIECNMGAAGDMLTAALLELIPDREEFLEAMNHMGIPGVRVEAEPCIRSGITGTRVRVTVDGEEEGQEHHHHDTDEGHVHHDGMHDGHTHHDGTDDDHVHHDHHHHGMQEIGELLAGLQAPEAVKKDAAEVYRLIAEAESSVHGIPVQEIHFHEVGNLDAVADIMGACLLIHRIAPEKIICSPVHVGSGWVKAAHGILPVPAPAAAKILQGVPTYGGEIKGELCTPTGAALLKHFAAEFSGMPVMRVEKIGYGMGTKEFESVNAVRVLLGESEEKSDRIAELRCNLDDMTPEAVGFAMERLFEGGALDVFTVPIGMKKCRPGTLLTCMCREEDKDKIIRLIFRHTSTIGIREYLCSRYTLRRTERTETTPYGDVRIKTAEGWGVRREKAEYEDAAALARKAGVPISQVLDACRAGGCAETDIRAKNPEKSGPEEIFDVVDKKGEPTGTTVTRSEAHRMGIRHRTSHVWLYRQKGGEVQLLLQKRSDGKDSYPGCYDISSAGHIPAGDGFTVSALRELKEELGIEASENELLPIGTRFFEFEKDFHGTAFHDCQVSRVYLLKYGGEAEKLHFQESEISAVRWMNLEDVTSMVRKGKPENCIRMEEIDMIRKALSSETS